MNETVQVSFSIELFRRQKSERIVEAYIFLLLTKVEKEIHILWLTLAPDERRYILLLLLKTVCYKIMCWRASKYQNSFQPWYFKTRWINQENIGIHLQASKGQIYTHISHDVLMQLVSPHSSYLQTLMYYACRNVTNIAIYKALLSNPLSRIPSPFPL